MQLQMHIIEWKQVDVEKQCVLLFSNNVKAASLNHGSADVAADILQKAQN